MTAADVITPARYILNDTAKTRWTDPMLLEWTEDGQRDAVKRRPDIYVFSGSEEIVTPDPGEVAATSTTLVIEEAYRSALVNYVCWRALSQEIDRNDDAEAQNYFKLYLAELAK